MRPIKQVRQNAVVQNICDNTYQTPPVGGFSMADALNDLRCQILRRAAVRVGPGAGLVRRQALFGQAKVSDFDVSFMVQENVLRLQVTVDDSILVEISERFNELRGVEACPPLAELLVFAQMVKELAAIEEIHDKVELGGSLERIM